MAEPNRLAAALSYEQDRPAFGNPSMLEQGRKMRERKQDEQVDRSAQNVKSDLLARALMYRYNPETLTGLTDTPGPQTLDEAAGLDPRVDRSTFLPYSQKEGMHVPAVVADVMKLATASNPQYSNLMQPEEAMPLATNMMGGGIATSRLAPAPAGSLGMNVWHGTPHRFPPTAKNPLGEFDPTKIGTGEGAQAYGVGAGYLAEHPEVARGYQRKLADSHKPNVVDSNLQNLYQKTGDWTAAVDEQMKRIYDTPAAKAKMRESLIKQGAPTNVEGGALYKVDLPDEHIAKMLDWDKPLSQQPQLKQALDKFTQEYGIVKPSPEMTGKQYYQSIENYIGGSSAEGVKRNVSQDVSGLLKQYGIPGIRYLDQVSRGAGQGTSNFVVFDPAHMNIIGRE